MLKDIQDSHRINRHVKTKLDKQINKKEEDGDEDKKNGDENVGVGGTVEGEVDVSVVKEEREKEGKKEKITEDDNKKTMVEKKEVFILLFFFCLYSKNSLLS